MLAPWEKERFLDLFSLDENRRLFESWLNYDPVYQQDSELDYLFLPAIFAGERRVIGQPVLIPWDKHPAATRYWDTHFPDHCPGSQIVFPAVYKLPVTEDIYAAAVAVVCHHFEYGDSLEELARLYGYTRLIARELFNNYEFDSRVVLLNPGTQIILLVISSYLTTDYAEAMSFVKTNLHS